MSQTSLQIDQSDRYISLEPEGEGEGANAATIWQKHRVDMIGSTKFTFELTATKTSNFAFVLQREGLEA